MISQQKGKCAICKQERTLHVDHDHATRRVRALLCDKCNRGLGCFEDNETYLRAALAYIKRHNRESET